VIEAAVVVELTHLATLYHDDVMDSAPVRRGAPPPPGLGQHGGDPDRRPAVRRASRIVADLGPDAVRIQAETFERLCLGQMHETVGPSADEDPVKHYLQCSATRPVADRHRRPVRRDVRRLLGRGDRRDDPLRRAGRRRVQLADDVIDLASATGESGKTPGTDLREGVPTLPVLLVRRAAAAGDLSAAAVVSLLDDSDLNDNAGWPRPSSPWRAPGDGGRSRRGDPVGDGRDRILSPLPEGPAKQALRQFAEAVVDRTTEGLPESCGISVIDDALIHDWLVSSAQHPSVVDQAKMARDLNME